MKVNILNWVLNHTPEWIKEMIGIRSPSKMKWNKKH